MKEFIVYAHMNRIKVENKKTNVKNPDCLAIQEKTCIRDNEMIQSYGIYDLFLDGMPFEDSERSNLLF